MVSVEIPNSTVVVGNLSGTLFAVDGACIRCGTSFAEGILAGGRLTCRTCGWQYDPATGRVRNVPALAADTYPIRVEHSRVLVDTTPNRLAP